jgi:predicted dehydrogenase
MQERGFGVIGLGNWGSLHARVYASTPGARLAAVCDLDADRARALSERCGGVPWFSSYSDLLADPGVEAVSVVLPDFLHREAVEAAVAAGKPTLVEKPLATTEADALAMITAAEQAGVTLCVDFHNRFSPLFNGLKQALDGGELGAPQMAHYRLNDTLFVPTRMLPWAGRSSVAWFLSSHCLDTLLWLLEARRGADVPERVFCVRRSRILEPELGIPTPDFYLTTLEFRSGFVAQLENCWILPESGPSVFDLKCEFVGSKGAYHIDASHHGAAQLQSARTAYPDTFVAPDVHGRPTGFGAESIRHFAGSVMQGTAPMMDGLDGLAVTRLILKMEESAERRQPVAVGDLYARHQVTVPRGKLGAARSPSC